MRFHNNDVASQGQTLEQAETMLAATRASSATTPLWCGECGPHNAGGLPNVTDTFTSSFWVRAPRRSSATAGMQR